MKTLVLTLALSAAVFAQPASRGYAIRNVKIHTLTGPAIERGTVVIRGGKIAGVGANVAAPAGAQVIDARGLEVYPGLIDSISSLGLTEISSIAATVDTSETGEFNPQLIAATAVHPASEHIPVARANGITHAVSAPGGGGGGRGGGGGSLIPGQASLIHLSGWTVEEMAIEPSIAMMLRWPAIQSRGFRGGFDPNLLGLRQRSFADSKREYDERVARIEDWLEAARHYAQAAEKGAKTKFERDLRLEALARVVKGQLAVVIQASDARDIKNAVEFAERHKLKMILAGGAEAWKVKDLLKQKNIPVILGPTQALPREEDDPYDRPFVTPGELSKAGVKIAIATFDSAYSRTLPYEAANAVGYGLPWEEAVKAVTLYPAQILGVSDRLGSIEEGKLANLIVTDGDPLRIQTQVKHLFIKGELTSTDNRHKQLYEKYRARP